jgi:hypothetical protein
MFIANFLKGYDVATHNNIIQKFVSHEIFISMVLPYLHDTKLLKHTQQLIENIKSKLSNHMKGLRSNKSAMVKHIVCTFASSQAGSNMGVTRVLGVDKKKIKKGLKRRLLVDTSNQAFWIDHKGVKRSKSSVAHFQQVVIQWWTTKTTISPNQKDVIMLKTLVR